MIMSNISPSDNIMARATGALGNTAEFSSYGFSDISEGFAAIRYALGSAVGTFRVVVRNASRGWTKERALFLAPAPAGTQLTLM